MKLDTWRISGHAFHFGRHGLGQEETSVHLTSDSLFAALASSLASAASEPVFSEWISHFTGGRPVLVLSSAFPCLASVRFFPTPLRHSSQGEANPLAAKTLKKVRYISEATFKEMLGGAALSLLIQKGLLLQNGQFLISPSEFEGLPASLRNPDLEIYSIVQRPRVTIGRAKADSNLYHTGQVLFSEDCGLWFAVRWLQNEPALAQQLENMLKMLGDAGLGGERSSGSGQTEFSKMGELELPDPSGRTWVALSRYLPAEDETPALSSKEAAYAIESVGGWIYSHGVKSERRRSINMLVEGSVLGRLDKDVPGQMADVQPVYENDAQPVGHAVWRSGFALAVGFQNT